jgi:hypothetical protein
MEEGVCQFYKQSGCPTLKWLITRAPKAIWREMFSASILNFFEDFFPITPYRELQLEAMVRIPITIALYAMKYVTGQVRYPLCDVSMLNVEDFRVLWQMKAEDLRLEISQRIDDLDTTKQRLDSPKQTRAQVPMDDLTRNQEVLSPPTPHRTNTSNDTRTPPEQSKDESKEEGMIADLSPIPNEEEKKQPWRSDDQPYPSMEPPKHLNHCTGWYERNTGERSTGDLVFLSLQSRIYRSTSSLSKVTGQAAFFPTGRLSLAEPLMAVQYLANLQT